MNAHVMKMLILTEMRLRLRRLSSLVTLLCTAGLAWLIFVDPRSGSAFIVSQDARVLYTSSALALGSVTLFGLVFGLAGFYLVRGRIAEDVRCGLGGVIGASPISNLAFLFARWLGGVGYLLALAVAFMLSIMVCHLFRGEGPLQLMVYLETYCLVLLPLIFFSVSCAILFDSIAPLMGKLGDVVYFFVWIAQIGLLGLTASKTEHAVPITLIDFYGLGIAFSSLSSQLHTHQIAIGITPFDPSLPPIVIVDHLWSMQQMVWRMASGGLACFILLPAFVLFHRYSTDKVKVSHTSLWRSPWTLLNQMLRPFAAFVSPLFFIASVLTKVSVLAGQALAEVAVTLISAPSAIFAALLISVIAVIADATSLSGVLICAAGIWGVVIADIGTRDFVAGCESLTAAVVGGENSRYLRHVLAAIFLGMLFMGVILLKMLLIAPLLAVAVVIGVVNFSVLSCVFSLTARSSRLFLSLFLFWLYVSTQVRSVPMLDVLGFNGVATTTSMLLQLTLGLLILVFGYAYQRRAS